MPTGKNKNGHPMRGLQSATTKSDFTSFKKPPKARNGSAGTRTSSKKRRTVIRSTSVQVFAAPGVAEDAT